MDNLERHEPVSEIDLVDIWLMIRRYRWLFAGVFLIILVLGLVTAEIAPVKYNYTVAVNIGAIRNITTGKLDPILPQDAETDALRNAIIPAVLETYAVKYPQAGLRKIDVGVSVTKDGSLVTLNVQNVLSQDSLMRAILSGIVEKMIQSQNGLLNNHIASTKQLLNQQIADIKAKLTVTEKSRQQLIAHGNNTDKAFTLLVLDDHIASLQRYLFTLQQQLNLDLPTDVKLTEPVGPPQRSLQPNGLGKVSFMGGAFIAALILAFLAVFIANLKDRANQRNVSVP